MLRLIPWLWIGGTNSSSFPKLMIFELIEPRRSTLLSMTTGSVSKHNCDVRLGWSSWLRPFFPSRELYPHLHPPVLFSNKLNSSGFEWRTMWGIIWTEGEETQLDKWACHFLIDFQSYNIPHAHYGSNLLLRVELCGSRVCENVSFKLYRATTEWKMRWFGSILLSRHTDTK